jgi:nitrogen fixation/metabolism regulation signal transduction histidine kinase
MIHRVIRYKDNQSIASLLINCAVLAYIVYVTIQSSNTTAKYVLLAIYAFLFFIPLAFSTFLSNHVLATVRLMKYSQYALYAFIILLITNVVAIPALVFLAMVFIVIFSMGVAFWFYSHPSIMTNQAYLKVQNRNEAKEEELLIKEVQENRRQLDNDSPG